MERVEREDGFYWVRDKDLGHWSRWEVDELFGGEWVRGFVYDEIGPRIPAPDEPPAAPPDLVDALKSAIDTALYLNESEWGDSFDGRMHRHMLQDVTKILHKYGGILNEEAA